MKCQLPPREVSNFRHRLLAWYRCNRRDLPWRLPAARLPDRQGHAGSSRSPYRIWIAEIMLQQTRIAAVLPYYQRFLDEFPDVRSLAAAPQSEVLRLWSGLGYYSRARNLHAAARAVVADHAGEFPRTLDAALALPGIGSYTAAAILSIAYDVPLAALDGNVARVLARLFAIRGDLRAPRRWHQLAATADRLLAQSSPGDWNQALMELGETICTPQNPRCSECPVQDCCRACERNLAGSIPSARRKPRAVRVRIAAAVFRDPRGRTLLVRDSGARHGALFSHMWQFPSIEISRQPLSELEKHLRDAFALDGLPLVLEASPAVRHRVTFRDVTLLPFLISVARLPKLPRSRAIPLDQLHALPISNATRKIAKIALQSLPIAKNH